MLVGIGVEVTFEVITAAVMLQKIAPSLRVRVVNVTDLMVLCRPGHHPHALTDEAFSEIFTKNKPVHFNYHGYPMELQGLLFGRPHLERISIEGYQEEGTTTTPLAVSMIIQPSNRDGSNSDLYLIQMLVLNKVSRYDIAKVAIEAGRKQNAELDLVADKVLGQLEEDVKEFWRYVRENGKGTTYY